MIKITCPVCGKCLVCRSTAKEEQQLKDEFSKHFSSHYHIYKKGSKTQK